MFAKFGTKCWYTIIMTTTDEHKNNNMITLYGDPYVGLYD